MLILIGSYLCIPESWPLHHVWQVLIGWLAAGCMLAAIRINQLPTPIAWWFCAAGIFLNASGIGVDYLDRNFFGYTDNDIPMPADGFWLMLFPTLVIGLSILAHRRAIGQDWSAIIDAAIVMTGLSLLSWVFIVSSSTQNALTLPGLFVVVAYPVGDLAVLGVLVRLLLQGSGNTSLRFITFSLGLFLFGDLCWAITSRFEIAPEGFKLILLESVFLSAYALMGAAAVHPSSREIIKPILQRAPGVSLSLLITLAMTSLVPAALLLYQAQSGAVTNGIAISISSGGLFLLVIIRVVGLLRKVESQAEQLNALSRIDELTGLYNRRAWIDALHIAIERARRDKTPFTVALLDLDFFKKFNDSFGHQAGDKLLQSAAIAWLATIRLPDILGRYGGEEFILLLPNTNLEGANNVIERLRPVVPANQTFSSGLALWDGSETIERLLLRIDQALYRAKERGRNRTVLAGHE